MPKLTATEVAALKPKEKVYRKFDSGGLFLEVQPHGSKLWRIRYRLQGRERRYSLGSYPEVSLADARAKVADARVMLAKGIDPGAVRQQERAIARLVTGNSFEAVARRWWSDWRHGRTPRHADYVLKRFEADVFPVIGSRPMGDIQAPELVRMAKGIVHRGADDLARRALQKVDQVFRWAVAHGVVTRNPANDFNPADVLPPKTTKHHARIDAKDLPELLRKIDAYDQAQHQGDKTTKQGLQLLTLTFVRTAELIGARWAELDLDKAEWRIPAERMKMKSPHIVPLATQAVALLREIKSESRGEFVFPGAWDHRKPISNNTLLFGLYRLGYRGRMTGHGFRGLASTVLHEHGWPHEHIELQLAHQDRDEISAAYNHAQHLQARRTMMQWWADYLDRARVVTSNEGIE
jgi:integrase